MVIFRIIPIQTLLVCIIVSIRMIYCVGTGADEAGPSKITDAPSTSGSAEPPPAVAANPMNDPADHFVMIWNKVNVAIGAFKLALESQNKIPVLPNRHLEEADLFEAGTGLIYGALRLKFSFEKDGQSVQSSAIIQVPELGAMHSRGVNLSLYAKERYMYENVLPLMFQSWPGEKLSPNVYAFMESDVFVMENLRESGFYTTEDVMVGLPACTEVFKSLAQFHALSSLHPNVAFSLNLLTVADRAQNIFHDKYFITLRNKYTKYVLPLLSANAKKLFDDTVNSLRYVIHKAYLPDPEGFNVILHGDPNRTNVLLRNDDKIADNIIGCKFVDFQDSRYGSPVIDLVIYLISSVQFEVYQEHRQSLFHFYLMTFQKTLEELGVDCSHVQSLYTLSQLLIDLRKYKLFFVYKLAFDVPVFWTRFSFLNTDQYENNYDQLLQSEKFISFFKSWMEVFCGW